MLHVPNAGGQKQSGQMHLKLNPIKATNQQAQVLSSSQQQKRRARRPNLNE
jgi:hypothetical protein